MLILYVALAGALGALARWGLSVLFTRIYGPAFPWGTLAVNLIGCFLLGLLMTAAERRSWVDAQARVVLAVGFIGTFTTFSTFAYESYRIARAGEWLRLGANLALNVVLGFFLVWLGAQAMHRIMPPRNPAPVQVPMIESTIGK
jgi:CrcB protein